MGLAAVVAVCSWCHLGRHRCYRAGYGECGDRGERSSDREWRIRMRRIQTVAENVPRALTPSLVLVPPSALPAERGTRRPLALDIAADDRRGMSKLYALPMRTVRSDLRTGSIGPSSRASSSPFLTRLAREEG
jgi:hypothetical protein